MEESGTEQLAEQGTARAEGPCGRPGPHCVPCVLTVSLAVPALATQQKPKTTNPPDRQGKRAQADELGAALRTKRCYHIEYFLLPDDLVPRKLDLVVFGMAAKLFAESDSKIITPWLEDDQMWISWNHNTNVDVTNEFLIKLRDHKITLKLWDTKDKVFSEARLGKPDVMSSTERDAEAAGGVKHTVLLQRKLFEGSQPAPSCTKTRGAKESKAQKESSALPITEETDQSGLGTSSYGLLHPSKTDSLTVSVQCGDFQPMHQ